MVYTVIFIVAIATSLGACWCEGPNGDLIGCLMYVVPFALIPFAGPLERASINAVQGRRRSKGLPIQIMTFPNGEKIFRMAIYVMLALAICLFFFGFWLIGYLYPGVD
jgi:hypothetical protein